MSECTKPSREWTGNSRADTGEAECAAHIGQGHDAEQHKNKTAQRTFPREQSRPSRTVSHQRARAGENTTDPRNQSRTTSEKGELRANEELTWPQLGATPAEIAQGARESSLDLSPHGALGGFAHATAAFVASTPTSTSGVSRLGDGGCSDRGPQSCRERHQRVAKSSRPPAVRERRGEDGAEWEGLVGSS